MPSCPSVAALQGKNRPHKTKSKPSRKRDTEGEKEGDPQASLLHLPHRGGEATAKGTEGSLTLTEKHFESRSSSFQVIETPGDLSARSKDKHKKAKVT